MLSEALLLVGCLLTTAHCWVPPGMSEHFETKTPRQAEHEAEQHHHMHSNNQDVADIMMDTQHLMDDMGDIFSQNEIEIMEQDQKLFLWFEAHDWDKDDKMDGLELFKSLSHDHNYHHTEEVEEVYDADSLHDPHQHTPPALRQRFRRTEKIVDQLLREDDLDSNGALSFSEFVTAFRAGKMDGLKVKKTY